MSGRHRAGQLGLGWAACLGESMLQLLRVGWRLLACQNGPSPDCIIVVVGSEATMREQCLCHQRPMNCAREPSMAKNSSPSGAPKTGAQLRDKTDVHNRKRCSCGTSEHLATRTSATLSRTATVEHHSFLHVWTTDCLHGMKTALSRNYTQNNVSA